MASERVAGGGLGRLRAGGTGDLEDGPGERVVLVVEGAPGHRDPDRGDEPPAPVQDRRGDAAEVLAELLALDREAAAADRAQLVAQGAGVGDRVGGEAP